MAEGGSSGEKTEQPTPKKIRDARKKGQVARSQEVVTTASLLAVVLYLWLTWGINFEKLVALFDQIAILTQGDFHANLPMALYLTAIMCVLLLIPVLGVVLVIGIAANYFQIGALFAFENLIPKMEKLNPAAGAKRIFSKKQVFDVLKAVVKIIFLSIVVYMIMKKMIGSFLYTLPCGMSCLSNVTSSAIFNLFVYTGIAFILISAVDFVFQRHSHTKSLMMTKDEVKREYKEMEGDPHVKGRRRELARELLEGGDEDFAVRNSSAMVVNPTHLAVLLRYQEGETPLPIVMGKMRNLNAYRLRAKAEKMGIPVFRNIELARSLYADASVGGFVPEELFEAIAEILAWIARNKELLYNGPLNHGVIDMEEGDHRKDVEKGKFQAPPPLSFGSFPLGGPSPPV